MSVRFPQSGVASSLAQSSFLMPQESMLDVRKQEKQLFIGIPKEISFQENRIALVPESVALLVSNGHQVSIEAGAGANANFTDSDYSEAGAQIVYSPEEVYKADLIMKIAPPSMQEVEMMQEKQLLFSILQLSVQNSEFLSKLSAKKVTALAYEFIKDQSESIPVIRAMSEIVGITSVLVAAEYLSNSKNGKGEILGGITGIPPTEVLILGAGTVGEFAARTALGLGANVKVFDNSIAKLKRLQTNLGVRIYTSTISPSALSKALKTADVVVGSVYSSDGRAPVIVSEEMVSAMGFGSIIIDVSIDQGGNFETSEITNHSNPTFNKYGVIHYCVPNIASRVARTASYALSNIFSPIILSIGEEGGLDELLWKDKYLRYGVYLFRGTVTNKYVSEKTRLPFRDLNLLMASRI
ncbi:MAG: alanine dehydrogenase [Bacteroidia bacterium]